MEAIGSKLRRQRLRMGLTLDELAGRAGISKPYLSLIETGRVPNPPSDDKLRRLEQSLGFTSGELVTQAHLQRTPRDVRAVLRKLIQGNGDDSNPAANEEDSYLSGLLHHLAGEDLELAAANAVPVINKVAAGYPTNSTELSLASLAAEDYVGCPDIRDKDAFAARVAGDSMTPKYSEGNIVIFSPALAARNGDDCFVRFEDGQSTFRRVFFEADDKSQPVIRLQPRNERYRAQVILAEKAAGLYRAVFRYERVDETVM